MFIDRPIRIGEAAIASRLGTSIEHVSVLAPYADTLLRTAR
jgi:hypothetical protein